MTEETKHLYIKHKFMHPRVKEVLEEIAPPSPMAVPRDKSQPRAGNLLSMHKDQALEEAYTKIIHNEKPDITLNLSSGLLRRRKQT